MAITTTRNTAESYGAIPFVNERYELKYIVHRSQLAGIRRYVRQFCDPDLHGVGDPPNYLVTTLQLDTPFHDLCLAKERDALNRFKLRIRAYGEVPNGPIKLEIKQKNNNVFMKRKAEIGINDYDPERILDPTAQVPRLRPRDVFPYLEFVRLVREISARPAMYIRYIRESYNANNGDGARITLDSRMRYAPTRRWELFPRDLRWRCMDTPTAFREIDGDSILELKSGMAVPTWMLEMIERFGLTQVGFCKYAVAYRLESIYRGYAYSDASDNCSI